MQKNRLKIAFVIKSSGLEYDDRVRKEYVFLKKFADIKIYINFNDNKIREGVTSYGAPYQSVSLKSRYVFNSKNYLLIKAIEFYLKLRINLKNYDIVWAHEENTFIFPLLSEKNKCVWDHHELPVYFNNKLLKYVFKFIEKKSLFMVHANKHRIDYLKKLKMLNYPEKNIVLRNLPDIDNTILNEEFFVNNECLSKYNLEEQDYIYIQGVNKDERYPYNTIASLLDASKRNIVIIGGIEDSVKNALKLKYGEEFILRVNDIGRIRQDLIPYFIAKAKFSVILYENNTPNSRFCEPNRMFQALGFEVPIIVGSNEPMSEIVKINKCGIVLDNDGRDLEELIVAVKNMEKNYDNYKANTVNMVKLLWDYQYDSFNIIKDLLNSKNV